MSHMRVWNIRRKMPGCIYSKLRDDLFGQSRQVIVAIIKRGHQISYALDVNAELSLCASRDGQDIRDMRGTGNLLVEIAVQTFHINPVHIEPGSKQLQCLVS